MRRREERKKVESEEEEHYLSIKAFQTFYAERSRSTVA